jgi:hypothetical protein
MMKARDRPGQECREEGSGKAEMTGKGDSIGRNMGSKYASCARRGKPVRMGRGKEGRREGGKEGMREGGKEARRGWRETESAAWIQRNTHPAGPPRCPSGPRSLG